MPPALAQTCHIWELIGQARQDQESACQDHATVLERDAESIFLPFRGANARLHYERPALRTGFDEYNPSARDLVGVTSSAFALRDIDYHSSSTCSASSPARPGCERRTRCWRCATGLDRLR
jgi:hypothetical protein